MTNRLENSLKETIKIIEPIVPNWFILGGTCLGYVRDKKLIGHDSDIDIGVYADEGKIDDLLASLPIHTKFFYDNSLKEVTLFFECLVDIFFLFPYQGDIVETFFSRARNKVRFYAYPEFIITDGIEKNTLNGITVNVLIRSKEYCEHLYGKDYMVERKDWDPWTDPLNMVFEDDIISPLTIKNIPQLDSINYYKVLEIYLQAVYQLAEQKRFYVHPNYFSLNKGLSGFLLFLYEYAKCLNDPTSYNLAVLILAGNNRFISNSIENFSDGIIGYGFLLSYLYQNHHIEIVEEIFFDEIDTQAVNFLNNFNADDDISQLIGSYSYILDRLEGSSEEAIVKQIQPILSKHIRLLSEHIFSKAYELKKNTLQPEGHLVFAKGIILLKKLNRKKQLHNEEFGIMLTEIHSKLETFIDDIIDNHNMSFTLLYAISKYTNSPGNFINQFHKLTTTTQPFGNDSSLMIHNLTCYICLCNHFKINLSSNIFLHKTINNFFFKNNIFDFVPYERISSVCDIKLYGGLSGIGLLLLSLFPNKRSAEKWDKLLLLS